jgi:predicted permease
MSDACPSTPSPWSSFVREHLRLSGVRAEREAEIVEDLARQLDDAYREAMASGVSEREACSAAERHISDWAALSKEISESELQKMSQVTQWQNRSEERDLQKRGRFSWLTDFRQDVLYGLRMLRKTPGVTGVALLSLALGIGATTAIFSVVDAVLLRPMPFKDPGRIVELWNSLPKQKVAYPGVTFETLSAWSAADFLEPFEGYQPTDVTITGATEPKRVLGAYVSGGLMTFLGARPEIGRPLLPDDGKMGADRVAVLSYSLWTGFYGADPSIVGRTIGLNNLDYQVVGVMPPNFRLPRRDAQVWLPFSMTADSIAAHKLRPWLITKVIPQVPVAQAQQRMDVIAARLGTERPRTAGWSSEVLSLEGMRASPETRRDLLILLGAVAFVLAISCVNTANIQLSQSVVRERDAAVRAALGASRWRLIRQSLTESVLLGLAGGVCGVLLAFWIVRVMVKALPPAITMVNMNPIELDKRVLLFAIAISCITGIAFGLIPSLRASRLDVSDKLAGTGRSNSGTTGLRRLRNALVVAQVGLSFALLVGAGLMIKSLRLLYEAPEGFNQQNLVALNLVLPKARYSTGAQQSAMFEEIEGRLAATPALAGATFASGAPPNDGGIEFGDIEVEGRAKAQSDKDIVVPLTEVAPNYFQVLGAVLVQGRSFDERDGAAGAGSVIINQKMAQKYWPGATAIGKRFRLSDSPQDWRTIVGVVSDIKQFDFQDRPAQLEFFIPLPAGKTADSNFRTLIVRTRGNTAAAISAAKEAIWSQDKEIPIDKIATYEELVSNTLATPQFYVQLMALFAAIALLLSMIGIYGVISYSTTLRTREIGIRMALGAQANHVVTMVVREGLLPAGLGVLLGIGCSALMTKLIVGFLYGVKPADPGTFITVAAIYLVVALVASLLPARRASRVDPLIALRCE